MTKRRLQCAGGDGRMNIGPFHGEHKVAGLKVNPFALQQVPSMLNYFDF
jgi:hypothetical protein